MSRCFLWKLLFVQVCICLQRIDAISSALDDRYRFKVVHKQNNNFYITYCFSLVNIQKTSKTRRCLIIKMHSRSFLFKSGILLLVDFFFPSSCEESAWSLLYVFYNSLFLAWDPTNLTGNQGVVNCDELHWKVTTNNKDVLLVQSRNK